MTDKRGDPLNAELSFNLPDVLFALSRAERVRRCVLAGDDCAIRFEQRGFVRGVLPLQVVGEEHPYNLGVWAEVSLDTLQVLQGTHPELRSGTLANNLPLNPKTQGLNLRIEPTGKRTVPRFVLEAVAHPLYEEQRKGITLERALEYQGIARGGLSA